MSKVAFIGLGVMGYPMAGHLKSKGGHDVTVYNRSSEKAENWVAEHGGSEIAPTPEDAARDCDFVFSCVGNDDDLRSVTTGPQGAFAAMKPGAIFIDCTTASSEVARELHEIAKDKKFGFLDGPLSGGQPGALNGTLTVMVGGDAKDFELAKPVIECFGRIVQHIGPSGSGQLAKMVNQICIAGLVQGLSEAINFGIKAELDIEKVISSISGGAAQSWQMENRWKTMQEGKFDFGFAVDWMRKDLGICLNTADQIGARLPITALIDQFYADVQAMGGNRWDTSSLIARLNDSKLAK